MYINIIMKLDKINIINNIKIEYYNTTTNNKFINKHFLIFLFKHLFNKFNICLNRFISIDDINIIKYYFTDNDNFFNKLNNKFIDDKYYLYPKLLLYDYVTPLFIYYYIFIKKYILNKIHDIKLLDLSYNSDLFESCLFSYYNDNYNNIFYYKLNYNKLDDDKIIDIYKNLNIYDINKIQLDLDNIIKKYNNKNINICNLYVKINNIYDHFKQIYLILNILNDKGIFIMNLSYDHYDYFKSLLYILNSLFKIKYPNFMKYHRKLIIFYDYDKDSYFKYYNNLFKSIIDDKNDKYNNLFKIDINKNFNDKFNEIYNRYNNIRDIERLEHKINKICQINKLNENNKCFSFNEFLKLIQLLYDKSYISNINLCKKYNLDIRKNIKLKYDKIISKLKQQLYTMNNDEIFQINKIYDKTYKIHFNFNHNNKFDLYIKKMIDTTKKLYLTKFYLDSRNFDKWSKIEYITNIRRSIIKYLDKEYNIKNSRGFIKMFDILNLLNIIDFNKKEINTLHVCEAPGNFINSINYFIKSNNKNMIFNWYANSIFNKDKNYLGDEYGFISKYPNRWDRLNDNSGDITKLDNILYIKNKYKNIDFYTSDCGIEYDSLDQENSMILLNYSQILIGLIVNKIGGHLLVKIFLPLSKPLSFCLIFLLHQFYDKLYFIRSSGGSLVSSEFYLIGFNKLRNLNDNEFNELIKIYKMDNIDVNYSFYEEIPEYFFNKLNEISENFIKTQIKFLKRSFIYFDNRDILNNHIKYFNEAKDIYCKEWVIKNNFKILDKSLIL